MAATGAEGWCSDDTSAVSICPVLLGGVGLKCTRVLAEATLEFVQAVEVRLDGGGCLWGR